MNQKDCDLTWIQSQLTLARWYLDAAASSAAGAVRHQLKKATDVYDRVKVSLSNMELNDEQRESVERELSAVRVRLETASDEP
jgi:hypothetical protein